MKRRSLLGCDIENIVAEIEQRFFIFRRSGGRSGIEIKR